MDEIELISVAIDSLLIQFKRNRNIFFGNRLGLKKKKGIPFFFFNFYLEFIVTSLDIFFMSLSS